MKNILLIILLCLYGCKYDQYIVMGASNTAGSCSWANQVNYWGMQHPEWGFPNMQVSAQPGIGVATYDFPDHQYGWGTTRAALYVLGTNDAYFLRTPLEDYRDKLRADIEQSQAQNLPLICMLPWRLPGREAIADPYRQISMEECPEYIDVPLLLEDSEDGVHMSCESHVLFAQRVLEQL